jgi:hypothetical protein
MRLRAITIALYLLSIAIGVGIWLSPLDIDPSSAAIKNMTADISATLAISITYTILQLVSVGLFLAGLQHFKSNLRRPYWLLCAGLITLALAQLQTPLAILFDAVWWLTSGLVAVLYVAPNILLFVGIRSFARLVGIRNRLTLLRFVLPLSLVPPLISLLLPVKLSTTAATPEAAHLFIALPLWQMSTNAVSAYLAWRIKQSMGGAYTHAMRWLFATLVAYALLSLHFIILAYIGYDDTWYGRSGSYLLTFVVLSTVFVIAGYKFWAVGVQQATMVNVSPLDVVVYTASLATNPKEVDSLMDAVRYLTANKVAGQSLTLEQEKTLADVYLKLEDYLINREPLRKFTREDLRLQISQQFPHEGAHEIFWGAAAAQQPPQK